jgi:hypothetical protein
MAEKTEADDFDESDDDALDRSEEEDLDAVFKDLDRQRKRGGSKSAGEPAWRKLEKYLEDKRTAQLLANFDDDFDEMEQERPTRSRSRSRHSPM